MSALPRVSGREVIKALRKAGYEQDCQRGSHIILRQVAYPHVVSLFLITGNWTKGTLRAIIRETGLTVEEFKALL